MDLARQLAHLLRQYGEVGPAPLVGGFVVEKRADDGVNVYWRTRGRFGFGFLRLRALRRYAGILTGLGVSTELREDGPEPYLVCWVQQQRSSPETWVIPAGVSLTGTSPARRGEPVLTR